MQIRLVQLLVFVVGVVCADPVGAASTKSEAPIEVVGTIEDVVDMILPRWRGKSITAISYRLTGDPTKEVSVFEIYNSAHSDRAVYKDGCVSTGWERVVDCDLKMIDDLINEFSLIPIFAGKNAHAKNDHYRKYILLWVLSHEFGHIQLGHGRSDFREDVRGPAVFDMKSQAQELEADEYAVGAVGDIDRTPQSYDVVLDIANSLVRKSVCPHTFPRVCAAMPAGVGLIFDYTPDAKPIDIEVSGAHPDFIARFLRLLYLAGKSSGHPLGREASQAIDLLRVENHATEWQSIRRAFTK